MRLIPIFDTNIFGDAQSGDIPPSDWKRLLRHRPGHGWPLSIVTLLELLVDLDNVGDARFPELRQRMELAHQICKGRVLDEPRVLICADVLEIPFPTELVPPPKTDLLNYMQLIRRANSLKEILDGRVRVGRRWAGLLATDAPKNLVGDVKRQWIRHVEGIADHLYPAWREHFTKTGRRLPVAVRRKLNYRVDFESHSGEFAGGLLDWLGAKKDPNLVSDMSLRLDAVLRFTAFVVSQFLEGN